MRSWIEENPKSLRWKQEKPAIKPKNNTCPWKKHSQLHCCPLQREVSELERELQREKVQSVLIVEEFWLFPNEQDQN